MISLLLFQKIESSNIFLKSLFEIFNFRFEIISSIKSFLLNLILGLKKSFSLLEAIPHILSIEIIEGSSEIKRATAPAP